MILSFANTPTKTEQIWNGQRSRRVPLDIQTRGLAKLALLNAADVLDDLRNPPGNRLHDLKDDRAGQHSISINKQWRICFRFKDGNAYDVEIIDYHD
ncbi:MAG: type II toxin-antitoxin system RelE/ParE family toxin [Novosphingobium sp.]